ncbi:MATE family efflux transporter [Mycoplasmatota bacterium WC44]
MATELKTLPIKNLLWKLSVPAIIGMTFNALYNIIDGIFVGTATGESGIAAISIVYPIQMIVIAIALTIGVGAASIYSRALGEENFDKASRTMNTAFLLGIIVSVSLSITGIIFAESIAYMFGMVDTFKTETMNYLEVIFYGSTLQVLGMIMNNMFRAEGKARIAMIGMIVGTVTNLILDPIFIFDFGLGLGTRGAAIATVIGYACSFSYLFYHQYINDSYLKLKRKSLRIDFKLTKEIIIVGLPALVRNSIAALIAVIINNTFKNYSVDPMVSIAIYGVVSKTLLFVFLPIFGVLQGLAPIIGYNYGAKEYDRTKSVTIYANKVTSTYFLTAAILAIIFTPQILMLFGISESTISISTTYMRLSFLFVPLVAAQIIISGYYQALGKSKEATFIALLRQLILLVPLALILPLFFGDIGVWVAIPTADLISSLVGIIIYKKEMISFSNLYLKSA